MKQMNANCFIDTNILLYCYSKDEADKRKKAQAVADVTNAYISTQVLTELSNTLKRKFHFSWESIQKAVQEVSSSFNIHINQPETIEKACQIAEKYKYSFYDSLIISAALSSNCSILYSEDMQNGQMIEECLTIVNPLI